MNRLLALVAAALFALPVSAHEGEDHGAPAVETPPADEVGPRAVTATELFELVAVASGDRLTLYLDRFATNEPISGAKIEVGRGAHEAAARELEAGVYQVIADELAQPGRHALTIAVQVGDDSDLLPLTIEGPAQGADAAPVSSPFGAAVRQAWRNPLVWGASGAVLLAGAGVVALRRNASVSDAGGQ